MTDSNSDSDPTADAEPDAGGAEKSTATPEIHARLYEMEVRVTGGEGDALEDVGRRFDETWERVLDTYREQQEADDTRPFQ